MGKPYSLDLRKRVVAAVLTGGLSCNQAAEQFGVAVSTAIGWVRRQRETGSVAPGKMGGHRPKAISGEHRVFVLERTRERRPRSRSRPEKEPPRVEGAIRQQEQ